MPRNGVPTSSLAGRDARKALRRHPGSVMWSSRYMPRASKLSSILSRILALALLPLAAAPVPAAGADATAPPPSIPPMSVRERVLRMTEFLDTILPGTLGAHNVTLDVSPKFADLRDREFFRVPAEIRYGASDRLEFIGGMSPFASNPLNEGRDHRWGPGEAKLGARYDLRSSLGFYDHATIGLETRIPLGKPPVPINDHYTHIRPFLATSRALRAWPGTTFYTNFSYDRSVKLTRREAPPSEVVRRHIAEVAPGLLYKPSEFGYFGEYRFRHIQEPAGAHFGHEVRIGTIWEVPLRRSEAWGLPGKWQLEVAYKFNMEEGRDRGHGVSARVNWRTTLRQVLDRVSNKPANRCDSP